MATPNNPLVQQLALDAISSKLSSQPGGKMKQVSLANAILWSQYSEQLGGFQAFVRRHNNLFYIETNHGVGNNVIGSRAAVVYGVINDEFPADGLYRPFDRNDDFFTDLPTKRVIERQKVFVFGVLSTALFDYDETSAQQCFDGAYAKCTRLTMSIGNVPDSADVTATSISNLLVQAMPMTNPCSLHVTAKPKKNSTVCFQSVMVTITGPDESCEEALQALCTALNSKRIVLFREEDRKILKLFQLGCGPVLEAVRATIEYLISDSKQRIHNETRANMNQSWRQLREQPHQIAQEEGVFAGNADNALPPATTTWPVEFEFNDPSVSTLSDQNEQTDADNAADGLLYAETIWPVEFEFNDPSECIFSDPTEQSDLIKYIAEANKVMDEKEKVLRARCAELKVIHARCAELREQPDPREKYVNLHNCEWIAKPEFELGRGSEAYIFMGLYKDPANPDKESILVAIKQSKDGISPFNSQERDHLMNLKRRPGIVQYHTSFVLDSPFSSYFILVQDIGLTSLEGLKTSLKKKKLKMTAEQEFKLTKALCMAVKDLHTQCSVVHRDLRPENVLLMRNGSMCITDFGLARTAETKGNTHNKTMQPKTIMQPYEVQTVYGDDDEDDDEDDDDDYDVDSEQTGKRSIPITRSGDVFMLGIVLAYIHQGKLPFRASSDQILNKEEPELDVKLETEQPWLFHLIRSMLDHDMTQRPSIDYVLKHPYFLGHSKNNELLLSYALTVCGDTRPGPKDNPAFRALAAVLLPFEQDMSNKTIQWHERYQDLFKIHKLPYKKKNVLLDSVEDAHPLPLLAQLLKWLRNTLSHLGEEGQSSLRRAKREVTGDSTSYYATFGEFFTTHPAVAWLLPAIWTATFKNVALIEQRRVALIQETERRLQHLQEELKATERVLEWSR